MPGTLRLFWSQPLLCPQGTKRGPNADSRLSGCPAQQSWLRSLMPPPGALAPSGCGALPPGSTSSQPLGPRHPCAGVHGPPSLADWAPPQSWFPGQHALAGQLKSFPAGGLCLHVRRSPRALGRSPKAGKLCLSLLSQSGKAHICFLSFFD